MEFRQRTVKERRDSRAINMGTQLYGWRKKKVDFKKNERKVKHCDPDEQTNALMMGSRN